MSGFAFCKGSTLIDISRAVVTGLLKVWLTPNERKLPEIVAKSKQHEIWLNPTKYDAKSYTVIRVKPVSL